MADEEIENILSQIRERVRAQPLSPEFADATPENSGGGSLVNSQASTGHSRESVMAMPTEARERIESYLTTTSRAWNRLPPLVSNRSGSSANLELWVKRQIKRATHWFTWEQINFNAAAHHAIRDMLETLAEALGKLQKLRKENESLRAEIQAQRAEVETDWTMREEKREAQSKELYDRLSAITQEMQERFEQLSAEQRVCFKQLSLEATEASVLEDRARRKAEALLEDFRSRLAQLELEK